MERDNDDITMIYMIREAIYVLTGLLAEYSKELSENPDLLDRLTTTKKVAYNLKWGYGVWIPKDVATYALKGIIDATKTIREELEKIREKKRAKGERTKSEQSSRLKRAIERLIDWIMDRILRHVIEVT